jgi:Holliday junction DNA helicase RuvA
MIDYIKGEIIQVTPTYVVIETGGIGYSINISLTTFTQLEHKKEFKILIHEVIREDSHQLFGFAGNQEREIFRYLISVSGVGANTARMMLSSLNPDEIERAILSSDINLLKSVKGIGLKTAQRLVIELKDKLGKHAGSDEIFAFADNTKRDEALSALVMLGFAKSTVSKIIDKIVREEKNLTVEDIIKRALKNL